MYAPRLSVRFFTRWPLYSSASSGVSARSCSQDLHADKQRLLGNVQQSDGLALAHPAVANIAVALQLPHSCRDEGEGKEQEAE